MTLNNGSGVSFVYITVWQKIDNKTYYFEADGCKQSELVKVADKTYYFVENGEKKTGFIGSLSTVVGRRKAKNEKGHISSFLF